MPATWPMLRPGAEGFFRTHLPAEIGLREVWYPNFGDCLIAALEAQFAAGHRAACVLNSDSPTLPSELLAEMANILAEPGDRIVLGPSTDGGYYLLACKTIHRRLFEDIAWSTEAVCAQTLERAAEIGLPVHLLPEWYDVDDSVALRVLAGEVLDGARFHPTLRSSPARHSAACWQNYSNSEILRRGCGDLPSLLSRKRRDQARPWRDAFRATFEKTAASSGAAACLYYCWGSRVFR